MEYLAALSAAAPPPTPPALPAPLSAVAVAPNPAFLDPPPARAMTDKAAASYEAYIGSGWTDAQLVQHGYMLA